MIYRGKAHMDKVKLTKEQAKALEWVVGKNKIVDFMEGLVCISKKKKY